MDNFLVRYINGAVKAVKALYKHSHKMPIVVFYRYMWENNKSLLVKTVFFNYLFQLVLEILPWWFSRRKVGNKLRSARIKLNYNMVTGRDFSWKLMRDFVYKTVLFAILDSFNRYMKNRVALENKFEIRRLVMEKILYAEVAELDKIKSADLEHKVTSDITSTLNFINKYLPSLVSGVYAFLVEGSSLFMKRHSIDGLALAYPIAITVLVRVLSWAQYKYYTRPQKKKSRANQDKLDMAMANALDGIIDIQTNNLQVTQLLAFDNISQEEIRNKEGLANFLIKTYSTLNKMSAFSYIVEIWCVHKIMKRQNLDHKQYSKIQQEIDHVVMIGRRTFNLLRRTKHIFQYQSKVVKLLDMNNFMNEHLHLQPFHMDELAELRLSRLVFSYKKSKKRSQAEKTAAAAAATTATAVSSSSRSGAKSPPVTSSPLSPPIDLSHVQQQSFTSPPPIQVSDYDFLGSSNGTVAAAAAASVVPPALDLRDAEDMVFQAGKRYAIIGQNTAGKSTLTKLITKLYSPDEGEISINGVPYADIPRVQLREIISYIPQRPLIVAGTIQDNILIGNPDATEEEVMFAAEASGLLEFLGVINPTAPHSSLHVRSRSYGNLSSLHLAIPHLGGGGPGLGHHSPSSSDYLSPASFSPTNTFVPPLPIVGGHGVGAGSVGHALTSANATGGGVSSGKKNKRKQKKDKTEKKKRKKKQLKRKKHRARDSDSDDTDNLMTRTLSFAELGEIVQPHQDFYDSTFSTNKYPVHLTSSLRDRDSSSDGSEDDDLEDDSDSDVDSDDGNDSDDIDEEEAEIHVGNDDDEDDEEEDEDNENEGNNNKGGVTKQSAAAHASTSDEMFSARTRTSPYPNGHSAHTPDSRPASPGPGVSPSPSADAAANANANVMSKAERAWLKKKRQILNQTVAAAGADVSGGFAQSIALARVFVRTKAKIIILDEATSQMDQLKLRTIVFPKLFAFAATWNMCLIVITHNLLSMADFDTIFVMHEGQLVHRGPHYELLEHKAEIYCNLLGIQSDSDELISPRHSLSRSAFTPRPPM